MCVVSVCLLPRNLGECFISLLVEPIDGKNVSLSDHHLKISSLLLMSAENAKTLTFVSLKLCFLD